MCICALCLESPLHLGHVRIVTDIVLAGLLHRWRDCTDRRYWLGLLEENERWH